MTAHQEMLKEPHLYMHRIAASNYQEIKDQWQEEAGEDEFEVLYANSFESMFDDLEKVGFNVPVHACLFDEEYIPGSDKIPNVEALLELTDTKRGTMTKLATIRLAPRFIDWESDVDMRQEVSRVYSRTLAHLITFGQNRAEKSAHSVKIYGRTNGLLELLKEIATKWDEIAKLSPEFDSHANMEGRWLKIDLAPLEAKSK